MRQQPQPVPVDRPALEIAHTLLCSPVPLDEMLKNKALEIILLNVARGHTERRALACFKKLQANDRD
jgi:hypothetical protein